MTPWKVEFLLYVKVCIWKKLLHRTIFLTFSTSNQFFYAVHITSSALVWLTSQSAFTCSKSTVKTSKWRHFGIYIVNFAQISHCSDVSKVDFYLLNTNCDKQETVEGILVKEFVLKYTCFRIDPRQSIRISSGCWPGFNSC